MSGDVQPRKRKDRKRKREDDESSHGVHITKMAGDDVHLHVHQDHGTGGHWCAKLFFFSLLAILLGLIALIIVENRGLADLDTPLSESRFSNYFDGWVDENRPDDHEHDEHDVVQASLEEHDEHDEPFEEEEDQSENDQEAHHGEEEDDDADADAEKDNEDDDENEQEDDETDNATQEAEADEEEDADEEELSNEQQTVEDEDEDDEQNNDDDDEDNNNTAEQQEDNDEEQDENENGDENEDEDDADNNEDDEEEDNDNNAASVQDSNADNDDEDEISKQRSTPLADGDNDPFDEDDDDDDFGNFDTNEVEEKILLQEQARKQQSAELPQSAEENDDNDTDDNNADEPASSWASSKIKPKKPTDDDLRKANEEFSRENFAGALEMFKKLIDKDPEKPQYFLGKAKCLDKLAEQKRSNVLLKEALQAYKRYLAFEKDVSNDIDYMAAGERCIDRMRFLGTPLQAIAIHKMLLSRFGNKLQLRNQLAVTYLIANRLVDAKVVLRETLRQWPNDGFAQVHYGFILNQNGNYKDAVSYLQAGIDSDAEGTQDGRFYFNLGSALQRLGRQSEAVEVYRRGANLKLFPSVYQRSLYNEPNLKAKPFWTKKETTYEYYLTKLEQLWVAIRAEGLSLLNKNGTFQDEAENLRDSGEWRQFELFAQGRKIHKNCEKAPLTCKLIEPFRVASGCRRGQVKFSVMQPGTHVWPHCGPTNCRLRAHLGLVVPKGTRIRVAEAKRTWTEGKFLIFDDSFEHEVWHNGSSYRLVLIVDFWHPDLTEKQRQSLPPI